MNSRITCPRVLCHSRDVSPIGITRKPGIAKGIVGSALFGPLGGMAGLMSGKQEATFICNRCGKTFTVKV